MSLLSTIRTGAVRLFAMMRRFSSRVATRVRRSPRMTLTVLGSLSLVLLLAGGSFLYLNIDRGQSEQARQQAKIAGERDVTTLLSYDHNTIAQDIDQRSQLLTGRFKSDYTNLVHNVIIPGAQQQQLTTSTNVARSSVVRSDGADRVRLMLFLNQTTKMGGNPNPVSNGSRVEVGMQRIDGKWAVSELAPV